MESSEWTTPIVPLSNGDIRICGIYKITVNPQLVINKYPIPRVADLINKLEKGKVFSKLDLAYAYKQVELDDKSKDLTVISRGLFKYNRLSFGIASALSLFQNLMETFKEFEGVVIYFDDILVFGENVTEHNKVSEKVLNKLKEHDFVISTKKYLFGKNTVNFLDFQIDDNGLHVAPDKIRAITQINKLTNVTELNSFLGIVNYYAKFIKNYASLATPLFELLKKKKRAIQMVD